MSSCGRAARGGGREAAASGPEYLRFLAEYGILYRKLPPAPPRRAGESERKKA